MAKRKPSGDGMVRKRDDGRWEGRIVVGHKKTATPSSGTSMLPRRKSYLQSSVSTSTATRVPT